MNYRRPQPSEAATMAALHVQCWRESYPPFVPEKIVKGFSVEKRFPMWEAITRQPERIIYGAFEDDLAIGLAVAGAPHEKLFPDEDGQLAALYVLASHHRKGIGRKLLGFCARDWKAAGGRSLSLSVISANQPSRRFYESMGARFLFPSKFNWDGTMIDTSIYIFEDLPALIP